MSDTGTPADGGTQQETPANGTTDERLTRVESAVDRLAGLVERVLPAGHAQAQQHTAARLDEPSTVQQQVRDELARAEREKSAAEAEQAAKSEQQQIRDAVRQLQEKPPAAPVPRRTRMLGWG